MRQALADGLVTGLAVTAVVWTVCRLLGMPGPRSSEIVFLAGALLVILSSLWAIAGYESPPGVLSILSGRAEVYPSASPGRLWVDRFVHVRNVWLTAGFVAIAASFALAAL